MANYQARNRLELSVDILHKVIGSELIDSVATGTVDTSSLQDTYALYKGGTDHYKGRQVVIYDATGSIADGSKSWVASSASTDCTCSPAFLSNITTGDKYLLLPHGYVIEEVYNSINQQIQNISGKAFKDKVTETTYTERDVHEYNCLSGFTHLDRVEAVYNTTEREVMSDSVWTGATSVTASNDTEFYRGHTCTKLNVADAVAAAANLGYVLSDFLDYSNYDTIELWIRSSIAQTAGNLELVLCSDTAGATAVDTISLPALTIDTWTRLQLTMTNPELDTAIKSIALKQKAATDVGACLVWVEYPIALKARSRQFITISPEYWSITHDTTPRLRISPNVVANDALLRLTGYQLVTLLSDNTTDADLDPAYIIAGATADMLAAHAVNPDVDNKLGRAKLYMEEAERYRRRLTTNWRPDTVRV